MQETLCGQKIVTQEHIDAYAHSKQPSTEHRICLQSPTTLNSFNLFDLRCFRGSWLRRTSIAAPEDPSTCSLQQPYCSVRSEHLCSQPSHSKRKQYYSIPLTQYSVVCYTCDMFVRVQANRTFSLFDVTAQYAREWLNVSQQLRDFLQKNKTRQDLIDIQQVRVKPRKAHTFPIRNASFWLNC